MIWNGCIHHSSHPIGLCILIFLLFVVTFQKVSSIASVSSLILLILSPKSMTVLLFLRPIYSHLLPTIEFPCLLYKACANVKSVMVLQSKHPELLFLLLLLNSFMLQHKWMFKIFISTFVYKISYNGAFIFHAVYLGEQNWMNQSITPWLLKQHIAHLFDVR